MARNDNKPYYGRCITISNDKEPWEGEGQIDTHEVAIIGKDTERDLLFAQVIRKLDDRGLEPGTIIMLREAPEGGVYYDMQCEFTDFKNLDDEELKEPWETN